MRRGGIPALKVYIERYLIWIDHENLVFSSGNDTISYKCVKGVKE